MYVAADLESLKVNSSCYEFSVVRGSKSFTEHLGDDGLSVGFRVVCHECYALIIRKIVGFTDPYMGHPNIQVFPNSKTYQRLASSRTLNDFLAGSLTYDVGIATTSRRISVVQSLLICIRWHSKQAG
jgi:hypothetical protein